jgi:N-acyl-D-amino-acid deacylase
MAYDLIIRNGFVVDGTGAPGRVADVAVADGRIAEIGKVGGGASREIDAAGRVVSPGFIDPHSHYDAQINWDKSLTPSPWHGVTTVVNGNCGVGVAPVAPAMREVAMHDLVNVEGMPYEVMSNNIPWSWESFPQFLDALDRRGAAVNQVYLAPLTPFRYYVMGGAAVERAATPDETGKIAALIREAVLAGAVGFSTTMLPNHIGHGGRPLACRAADNAELAAYARAVGSTGRGTIQLALTPEVSVVSDRDYELLDLLLTESGRPVTWSALLYRDDKPDACDNSLARLAPLLRRGAVPQTSALPLSREMTLRAPFTFMGFKSWHGVYNKEIPEQIAFLKNVEFRNRFREEMKGPAQFTGNWELISVAEVANPALKQHEGKTIAQLARETGKDGVDAMIDLGISDNLATAFTATIINSNRAGVTKLINNPDLMLGLADGGAHVVQLCDAGYPTYVLGRWVRERKAIPLEYAVKKLTSQPADVFGLGDRGRLAPGKAADIAVFDLATVNCDDRPEKRNDLPGGARRVVMKSHGVDFTIVNGTVVYERGDMTGAYPGTILRH